MLLLAGCAGFGGGGEKTGTVSFYVSDQQNAIDQFESLNVTVAKVAFRPANASNESLVVRDINDTTVDLTELQGANATLLENVSVPADDYTGVFGYVENATGDLTNGGTVNVTVPSQKLHVNAQFTVNASESVSFVYDLTVVETGQGKYILKPVVSESGTDVPIERTGGSRGGDGERGGHGSGQGSGHGGARTTTT